MMTTVTDILRKQVIDRILAAYQSFLETSGEDVRAWRNVPGGEQYPMHYREIKRLGGGLAPEVEQQIWAQVQSNLKILAHTVTTADLRHCADLTAQVPNVAPILTILYGRQCTLEVFNQAGISSTALAMRLGKI